MKKNVLVVTVVLLFLLNECSSTKVTIHPIDKSVLMNSRKTMEYNTFWDAMKNLDMSYTITHEIDKDHRYFAEALKLIIDGNLAEAENILKKLSTSSTDPLLRKNSRKILGDLLFVQSKWEKLLEFYSNSKCTKKADDTNKTLAEVFSNSPKENYSFPPRPIIIPIRLSFSGCPVIKVEINGHKKFFWLDTGAGLSAVASDVAKECNIYPIGARKIKAGTATGKEVDVKPAIIKDLRIGKLLIKNHPAVIINKKDLEFKLFGLFPIVKIDGIIGWNAIKNMNIEIDYAKKTATIRKPVKMTTVNRNFSGLVIPL